MDITEERAKIVDYVENIVTDYFGIERECLYASRGKELSCNAKFITWYIIHYVYGMSFSLISKVYGRSIRHIKYGVSKIKNGVKEQPYYREMYDNIICRIKEIP